METSLSRKPKIRTIHDDADLHVIDKPVGFSTVSERWQPELATVVELLWNEWKRSDPDAPRPHIVHRLDKETSGVLIFARHRDAQVELRRAFREREVKKEYLAVAVGHPTPPSGEISIQIEEDPRKPGRMRVCRKGKQCDTAYETVETFRDLSVLRLRPHQGRTHQIRISLAQLGHPCAVDAVYGDGRPLFLSHWKHSYRPGRGKEEPPLLGRLGLHARRLELRHPTTGEPMTLEAEPPKDIRALLNQLNRWGRTPPR